MKRCQLLFSMWWILVLWGQTPAVRQWPMWDRMIIYWVEIELCLFCTYSNNAEGVTQPKKAQAKWRIWLDMWKEKEQLHALNRRCLQKRCILNELCKSTVIYALSHRNLSTKMYYKKQSLFFSNQSSAHFLKVLQIWFFFHFQKNKQNFSLFHFVSHKLIGCGKELTFPGLNLRQVLAIILTAWHILLYQWYILKNEEKAFILYERGKA